MINNIQTLFGSLQIEEIKAYLSKNGWSVRQSTGRLDFLKQIDSTGETRNLFLPSDPAHPKFRKLIPNLVFGLAVLEKREALEIANDIASCVASEPSTQPATEHPISTVPHRSKLQIGFRNIGPEVSRIEIINSATCHNLQPDEEMLIEIQPDEARIAFGFSGTIELAHGVPDYRIIHGLPGDFAGPLDAFLISWLKARLAALPGASQERAGDFVSLASPLVARFQFAVSGDLPSAGRTETWLRATSILICGLANHLEECSESQTLIFDLARLALAPAKLTFEINPTHTLTLWQAARGDDCDAPLHTLDWLRNNTRQANPSD